MDLILVKYVKAHFGKKEKLHSRRGHSSCNIIFSSFESSINLADFIKTSLLCILMVSRQRQICQSSLVVGWQSAFF